LLEKMKMRHSGKSCDAFWAIRSTLEALVR